MHLPGLAALHENRRVPVASKELIEFFMADAREDARIGDFVSVEMENGEDSAIRGGVQEFVRVPARGQRTGFRLAVTDHRRHDEVRIIKCRAKSMTERITQFAAFVNRAGRLRRNVAWNPAGEGKLFKQVLHSFLILRN